MLFICSSEMTDFWKADQLWNGNVHVELWLGDDFFGRHGSNEDGTHSRSCQELEKFWQFAFSYNLHFVNILFLLIFILFFLRSVSPPSPQLTLEWLCRQMISVSVLWSSSVIFTLCIQFNSKVAAQCDDHFLPPHSMIDYCSFLLCCFKSMLWLFSLSFPFLRSIFSIHAVNKQVPLANTTSWRVNTGVIRVDAGNYDFSVRMRTSPFNIRRLTLSIPPPLVSVRCIAIYIGRDWARAAIPSFPSNSQWGLPLLGNYQLV